MNQVTPLDVIMCTIISFIITITLLMFIFAVIERNEVYAEIMECMGSDRSEEAYHACFDASQVSRVTHASLDK
jgi:uncharacterized membrane protein